MARQRYICGIAAWLLLAGSGAAEATVNVFVEPQTTTAGQPVTVFGDSDCEAVTVDFGDGTPTESFDGPGPWSTVHVYGAPAPTPPGVWVVTVQGIACATAIDSAVISVIVNAGGGGPPTEPPPASPLGTLLVERLGLRFGNGRPVTRVALNEKQVQVFADMTYSGTGLLQGYWEVDGAPWSFVNRHLVFGDTVTIASPPIPGLPTIDPGVHRVRFVLTRPATGYTAPVALYFAGYDDAPPVAELRLLRPLSEARISWDSQRFEWADAGEAGSYRLSYLDAETREVVFRALTRAPRYRLTDRVLDDWFVPGRRYEWQVTSYDSRGRQRVRSVRRPFFLDALADHVPGQVVVATEWSMDGAAALRRVLTDHGLRELESHRLPSLGMQAALLQAEGDVHSLVRRLSSEDGVVLAEPNVVLGTLGAPPGRAGFLDGVLDLATVHRRLRGGGVRVALVDTSVDAEHPALGGRIVHQEDFVATPPAFTETHGTAVAGILAAGSAGSEVSGVAPAAALLAFRACRVPVADAQRAVCTGFDVARAIDAALAEDAQVVNLSLGGGTTSALIERLIEKGDAAGVRFVAPAGNARWQREPLFPASHQAVLAVAGRDEEGQAWPNDAVHTQSGLAAPAVNLFTTVPGGGYNYVSGTSYSSAIVSGLVALAMEAGLRDATVLSQPEADLCAWTERLLGLPACGRLAATAGTEPPLAAAAQSAPAAVPSGAPAGVYRTSGNSAGLETNPRPRAGEQPPGARQRTHGRN